MKLLRWINAPRTAIPWIVAPTKARAVSLLKTLYPRSAKKMKTPALREIHAHFAGNSAIRCPRGPLL